MTSFLRALKTVAWSFIGLRSRSDVDADFKNIRPLHLALAALMGVAALVGSLMLLVHWAVSA